MSWIERLNTDFSIVCGGELSEDENGTLIVGEGVKVFNPYWVEATKKTEYNISEFVFKGIQGSLVKRGTAKGAQYDMRLFFQGANHLDTARDFEEKCAYINKSTGKAPPLKITHPYYGSLYVQPVELFLDNTDYNITKVNMLVIETIKDNGTAYTKPEAEATITAQATVTNQNLTKEYVAEVPEPDVYDLESVRGTVNNSYKAIMAKMNGLQADADKYTKYYYDANALVNTAVFDTSELLARTQQLLGAPAYFADSVVNRLNMFQVQAELLNRDVNRILDLKNRPSRTLKRLYETNAGANIIGMCMTTILNITNDYAYRPDVLRIIDTIVTYHNQFVDNLILLQTLTGDLLDAFIPSAVNIGQIATLVNQTTSNLLSVSTGAKQQRTLILEQPSNIILLADRLYGAASEDNIDLVKTSNNIGLNELYMIEKGRQINYYV